MTEEKRLDLQNQRLRELVSYAKNNSPYFATLYQGIDENTPLTALPTTSKADMVVHFDEWIKYLCTMRE